MSRRLTTCLKRGITDTSLKQKEHTMTSIVISRILIEVSIPADDMPASDEAWLAEDWEVKLDTLRDYIELAAQSATPAGTTITVS